MAVSLSALRFPAVLDGLDGTDVEAAETFRAAMLPDGMAIGPPDVPGRADAFAKPAGRASFRIAAKGLVNARLPRLPFFMQAAAGLPQKLPRVVRTPALHGRRDGLELPLRQPCPDADAPVGGGIPQRQIVRDQPQIPRRIQSPRFPAKDFFRVREGRSKIRDAAGGDGKNIGIKLVYSLAEKVDYQNLLGLNVLTITI